MHYCVHIYTIEKNVRQGFSSYIYLYFDQKKKKNLVAQQMSTTVDYKSVLTY